MSNIADDMVRDIKASLAKTLEDVATLEKALAHPHPRPRTMQINLNMQLLDAKRRTYALGDLLEEAIILARRRNVLATGKEG